MIPVEGLENFLVPAELQEQTQAIQQGLGRITGQILGKDLPIMVDRVQTGKGWEILYYVLDPFCQSTKSEVFKLTTRQTNLAYYQIFGISIFSPPKQIPVLIAGRPSLSHNLFKEGRLVTWQDPFKVVRSTAHPNPLEQLLIDYAYHGPSLVYTRSFV